MRIIIALCALVALAPAARADDPQVLDLRPQKLSWNTVYRTSLTIDEGQRLKILAVANLSQDGPPMRASFAVAGQTVDPVSGLPDYRTLRIHRAEREGEALFEAIEAGQASIELYYHGGLRAERPSAVISVTVRALTGEAGRARAAQLAAAAARIRALGADLSGLGELRRLMRTSADARARRTARETVRGMWPALKRWFETNPDGYDVDVLIGVGEARVAQAAPHLVTRLAHASDDIVRVAVQSLARIDGEAAARHIAPLLGSPRPVVVGAARIALQDVTGPRYRAFVSAGTYLSWDAWWKQHGRAHYLSGD